MRNRFVKGDFTSCDFLAAEARLESQSQSKEITDPQNIEARVDWEVTYVTKQIYQKKNSKILVEAKLITFLSLK